MPRRPLLGYDYSGYAVPRARDVSRIINVDATLSGTGHGYEGPGMQVADIDFYRSCLNTMDDSIRGMRNGGAMVLL